MKGTAFHDLHRESSYSQRFTALEELLFARSVLQISNRFNRIFNDFIFKRLFRDGGAAHPLTMLSRRVLVCGELLPALGLESTRSQLCSKPGTLNPKPGPRDEWRRRGGRGGKP